MLRQWNYHRPECCIIISNDLTMLNKVKLAILGISYSQIHQNAYALILAEVDGKRRIPVVIGPSEAQSIALKIENVTPPRPLSHDLIVSFMRAFGVSLQEVLIHKFENGIFYSELLFNDGERQVVLDARTSDAIAIAIRTKTPIYTTPDVIDETGFIVPEDDDLTITDNSEDIQMPKIENYSVDELEKQLAILIEREEYEEAAIVNDILKKKKQTN